MNQAGCEFLLNKCIERTGQRIRLKHLQRMIGLQDLTENRSSFNGFIDNQDNVFHDQQLMLSNPVSIRFCCVRHTS